MGEKDKYNKWKGNLTHKYRHKYCFIIGVSKLKQLINIYINKINSEDISHISLSLSLSIIVK